MPTSESRNKTKRPYLARDERRRQLLEAAAGIVENSGWDQLNMSALAKETGTSRQLVYQHFDSLESLMVATGTVIFEQVYVETRATIARRDEDIVAVLARAQKITLDLPPGRASALWQIVASAFPADHALTGFGRKMRHLITNLWKVSVAEAFNLPEKEAAALTWMLIMAFWGGYRLVHDGELTQQEAIDRLNWMVSSLQNGQRL